MELINQVNLDLSAKNIQEAVFVRQNGLCTLGPLMGYDRNSIIQRKTCASRSGVLVYFPQRETLDFRVIGKGDASRRDNAYQVATHSDKVEVSEAFKSMEFQRTTLYEIQYKAEPLKRMVYEELETFFPRNIEYEILQNFTTLNYPNVFTANCNVPNTIPAYDRSVVSGGNYTSAQWYANATFQAKFNAFGPAHDANGPSVNFIIDGLNLMKRGGHRPNREHIIDPVGAVYREFSDRRKSFEGAVFLAPPEFYPLLWRDPLYKEAIIARGTVVSPDQENILTGSFYHGKLGGVHLFECPMMSEFTFQSAQNNHDIAWCLMLGPGALAYPSDGNFKLMFEFDQYENRIRGKGEYIRGFKALKYKPQTDTVNTSIEQGIVHMFAALS